MGYLQELLLEKDNLDPSFVHAQGLLVREITKIRELGAPGKDDSSDSISRVNDFNGKPTSPMLASEPPHASDHQDGPLLKGHNAKTFRRPGEYVAEEVVKLSEKVLVPVKEFPKFNFVGKLLGPRGNTLKRLQAQTGTKMSVLGKGSMRDKEKEDELRDSGDAKFAHLAEPLHVLIEVEGVQSDAHLRLAGALSEIKKYMTPENDDIRAQQMQEMAYLQSLEHPEGMPLPPQMVPMTQMTQIPMTMQPVARGRARQIIRGVRGGLMRGGRGGRGGKPMSAPPGIGRPVQWVGVARMPMPARGMGRALVSRTLISPRHAVPSPNHRVEQVAVAASNEHYDSYDATYDAAYDTTYAEGGGEHVYYDYSGPETYEYAPTSSANFQSATSYKSPSVRPLKRSVREAAYPY